MNRVSAAWYLRGVLAKTLWSGFGLGLAPIAPGTCGTLLGVLIAWLAPGPLWIWALGVTAVAVPLAYVAERAEGHDPSSFVLDEVAGYLVAMLWIEPTPLALTTAFFAFRATDIWKPWPVRQLERAPGGWGVTLDDLAAGAYAHGIVRLVLRAV